MTELIPIAVLLAINIWLTYRNSQQFLSYVDQYAICTSFLARGLPMTERATMYYAMEVYKQTRNLAKANEAAQAAYPAIQAAYAKVQEEEGKTPSDNSSKVRTEDGAGLRGAAEGDKSSPK